MDFKKVLLECAEKININLEKKQAEQFLRYKDLLLEWNKKVNLTAITEEKEIIIKHFADSLTCAKYLEGSVKLIDVGTGAGFPGIPLKILLGDRLELTLLDSLNKRVAFLNNLVDELGLKKTSVIHGRAEDLGKAVLHREKYDIVVSRAVANMAVLAEYNLPFVRFGGIMISMKGRDVEKELVEAEKAISILGGKIDKVEMVTLPLIDVTHSIVIIKKEKETPAGYPRKAGNPEKQPIRGAFLKIEE